MQDVLLLIHPGQVPTQPLLETLQPLCVRLCKGRLSHHLTFLTVRKDFLKCDPALLS